MSDEYNGSFVRTFKQYDETKTFAEYDEHVVSFDPDFLELDNITDIEAIMLEINKLSYTIFYFGSLCDSQTRVVQQLSDEFERWKADVLHNLNLDKNKYKSIQAMDRFLMADPPTKEAYYAYQSNLSAEDYKLSLLKRIASSLEKYGYKLHDLKDYNLAIKRNS